MIKKFFCLLFILINIKHAFAQNAFLKGRVFNINTNEPIVNANILIEGTKVGTFTNKEGLFVFENLPPNNYTIVCSSVGFEPYIINDLRVEFGANNIDISLFPSLEQLDEISFDNQRIFKRSSQSPLSTRTISATEIFRNPGSNRDISKVVQVFPGVASQVGFRNDLIVRGGAPNENGFYLDGIEVPNINHFSTQGSSGGPVGLINVNFIKNVDFYAGAFPVNNGNALSSVLSFSQLDGNKEKLKTTIMSGSTDYGITFDGPMSDKTTFLFSFRRSYLNLLFKALKLSFLPSYTDYQFKTKTKINSKNELTIIGLGAVDKAVLNSSVNDGITDEKILDRNNYVLGNFPENTQWNYTLGFNWKRFKKNGYQNFIISRNYLNNQAIKYRDNVETSENLILDYESEETENKFRFESHQLLNQWKSFWGIALEDSHYSNKTFTYRTANETVNNIRFSSKLNFQQFAVFGNISTKTLNNKLSISLGLRSDFNNYNTTMNNPLEQISPRVALSYGVSDRFFMNFNVGRYYQRPAFTVLGYRDQSGVLLNKQNNVRYILSDQINYGLEWKPKNFARITLEGFFKKYKYYPFSINNQVSLANLGTDFGVIGNEAVKSISKGRSYGIEFFAQQKLTQSVYGLISYTWVRSEFTDAQNNYIASSWDNRHLLNLTAGKKFGENWEFGLKYRLLGGAPYTPYNRDVSSLKAVWDVSQEGILDWEKLNSQRNKTFHQLDIRLDKNWYFKSWALNVYMDIQNILNYKILGAPFISVEKDNNGNPIEDPNDPSRYLLKEIENSNATILPSVGIMIDL